MVHLRYGKTRAIIAIKGFWVVVFWAQYNKVMSLSPSFINSFFFYFTLTTLNKPPNIFSKNTFLRNEIFFPVPSHPSFESWRHLTLLNTLIYKTISTFLQVGTQLFCEEEGCVPGSCIPLLISDLHRFLLQAGERENSGCPLYLEQRRQHGHL